MQSSLLRFSGISIPERYYDPAVLGYLRKIRGYRPDVPSIQPRLAKFDCARPRPSQILPQALEYWMPNLPVSRLRSVLDLRKQWRLDPDAAMGNAFTVGLGLSD
jgi:hypothetical protein